MQELSGVNDFLRCPSVGAGGPSALSGVSLLASGVF